MRALLCVSWIALVSVGCGDSHRSPLDGATESDGGGQLDAGPVVAEDGGPIVTDDGGPGPVDGGSDAGGSDAGSAEPCDSPGASEQLPCGNCGTVERFCTSDGEWSYGACTGEGACAPGTIESVACGNCGTRNARCTTACVWEHTGACTGEGECAPGTSLRTGEGCPSGQQRELTCNAACTFVEESACAAETCSTPGAIETVACGMCGEQERFCTSSRTWDYGAACVGEGVCVPGTTGSQPCGMCGTQAARCTTGCAWEAFGACTGEGVCVPGTMTRTGDGCPAGQTRLVSCNAGCSYTTVEACRADPPLDVMLLLDVTGSHATRVRDNRLLFTTRLIQPLIALGDVAVGVAYYADFPVGGYGSTDDRPFEAGIEPTRTSANVEAELAGSPLRAGSDVPESGIEALSILSGGAPPSSALPLICSSGRVAGGCWRPGALRVVILVTDAPQHNGPHPTGSGLYSPYSGITPAPATWPDVASRMMADGTTLIALVSGSGDAQNQHAVMISDLGHPASHLIPGTDLGAALDAAFARVRALGGY